jgi:PAS domain S-box-containing protein
MNLVPPALLASLDLPAILDDLPIGMAVLDREGRVLTVNTALERLTGFTREQARGVPCRHVVRSGLCQCSCPAEEPQDTDIVNRLRRRIPVRISAIPVRDVSGQELFRLDLVEDLSAIRDLERRLEEPGAIGKLVGKSRAMERILRLLPAMAQSAAPVLVVGETGTGKDAVAEAIHKLSPRSREPFVRVDCGPMSPESLDAALFGRGQTGGEISAGAFQRARGGTVYLSDVGELPDALQARLLKFLDEGTMTVAPEGAPTPSHVRLIASSPSEPEELVRANRLHQDLASRLSAVRLHLPPLRERREDIEFLLNHFLGFFSAKFRKNITGFTPKARLLLLAHDYPGNVRELRNLVEYAVMVCPRTSIPPECLPAHLLNHLAVPGGGT